MSSKIKIWCPSCQSQYSVPAAIGDRRLHCKKCDSRFTVSEAYSSDPTVETEATAIVAPLQSPSTSKSSEPRLSEPELNEPEAHESDNYESDNYESDGHESEYDESRSSKSRSSRSRSRSSSKSKSSKGSDLQPTDEVENDGRTSVFALMLGMMTTLLLLFGAFGVGSEKIVNEKYNAEQARRNELRVEKARADTLEEMSLELSALGNEEALDFTDSVSKCERRIEISNQILERGPKDEPMRQLAVTERILAYVKLYGLNFLENLQIPNINAKLEAAYQPYLDDENRDVFQHARVGQLTHRSFELINSDATDASGLIEIFADTIEQFPDSDYVSSTIEAHILVIIGYKPEHATMLIKNLEQRYADKKLAPTMRTMLVNLSDRMKIREEAFERQLADRWANGVDGRRELVQSCNRMFGQGNVGFYLLKKCLTYGHWLEQNKFDADAKDLYTELLAAAKRGDVTDSQTDLAIQFAEAGLGRVNLRGSTIDYRGVDSSGKALNDKQLKEQVVVVVYWSADSFDSMKYIGGMSNLSKSFEGKPITILAVCLDDELPEEVQMVRKIEQMRIIHKTFEGGNSSLIDICKPTTLPHLMLVGFGGKVDEVNLDTKEFSNKALALLMKGGNW